VGQKLTRANYLILSAGFLFLNILLGFKNGGVDLNQMVFRNYILYFLAAFCGTMFVLCLSNALPASPPLTYMGKNSLIIMATHMNCRFYGACFLVADMVARFLPQSGLFGYYLVVAVCMIVLEWIAITVINRFFPLLAGKPVHRL
jgi:fucose 4-O-acetylase-like acetyltransferase